MKKRNKFYKEPMFLFTSGSIRQAAWAGWYSALGNKKLAESYVHSACAEWIKELGSGRRYDFLGRYNDDIWKNIPERRLKELVDDFFKSIKAEIRRNKRNTKGIL